MVRGGGTQAPDAEAKTHSSADQDQGATAVQTKLERELAAARAELGALEKAREQSEKLLSEMHRRHEQSMIEAEMLRVEIDAGAASLEEARQALESIPGERAQAQAKLRQALGEADALRGCLSETERRLDAMRQSSSWRLTAPLRAVSRVLRRALPGTRK